MPQRMATGTATIRRESHDSRRRLIAPPAAYLWGSAASDGARRLGIGPRRIHGRTAQPGRAYLGLVNNCLHGRAGGLGSSMGRSELLLQNCTHIGGLRGSGLETKRV